MSNMRYLTSRPVLQDRHRAAFDLLTHHEVVRTLVRMQQDQLPLPRRMTVPQPASGEWLFEVCRDAGLDHASVVFSLCRETDTIGVGALTKLIGKPILVWRRPEYKKPAPVVDSRGATVAPRPAGTYTLDMVVLSVVPNPKKAGSSTWHRFALWRPGMTIAECRAAGLTHADIVWDIDASRRFVVLGTAQQWLDIQAGMAGVSGEGA